MRNLVDECEKSHEYKINRNEWHQIAEIGMRVKQVSRMFSGKRQQRDAHFFAISENPT